MTDPYITTEALFLVSYPRGESDLLAVLLTPGHGKIAARAKGAAKPCSPFIPSLQPLAHSRVRLHRKRSCVMTESVLLRPMIGLSGDVARFAVASLAVETALVAAAEWAPEPDLFALLLETADAAETHPHPATVLRVFLVKSFRLLGLEPVVEHCAVCGRGESDRWYASVADEGLVCEDCRDASASRPVPPSIRAFISAARDASWGEARRFTLGEETARAFDSFFWRHLESRFEAPLRSRKLLRETGLDLS